MLKRGPARIWGLNINTRYVVLFGITYGALYGTSGAFPGHDATRKSPGADKTVTPSHLPYLQMSTSSGIVSAGHRRTECPSEEMIQG